MIRILLSGCHGRMGRAFASRVAESTGMAIAAGLDAVQMQIFNFPVYSQFGQVKEDADIVVDFSHVSLTPALLDFCLAKKLPLVLCTTGVAGELEANVRETARTIPLFRSANMSLGISLLQSLIRQATTVLGDEYDIEIIEKHHNKKVDAPSGTALMLADAAASVLSYKPTYVYDRSREHRQRDHREIGLHAVRGGTIVGEHEAMFIGPNEVLTISHSAQSRDLFANGAVKAVEFLMQVNGPGLYNMDDLVRSLS